MRILTSYRRSACCLLGASMLSLLLLSDRPLLRAQPAPTPPVDVTGGVLVAVGQTLGLTASGGTPPYTWTSGNASLATVAGSGANNATGTVTGVAPGAVTITGRDSASPAGSDAHGVTVVGIFKVVVDGSSPDNEGPVTMGMGELITLRAKPDPAGAAFPYGYPDWSVDSAPAGSAVNSASLTDGQATVTVRPDRAGTYVIKAACGTSNDTITLTVVDRVTQSADLWWFGAGVNAANYEESVTLTAVGLSTGTFVWEITNGRTRATLNNGAADADSITATGDNTVTLKSLDHSVSRNDITIRLTHNGNVITNYTTTVFKPNRLVHLRNADMNHGAYWKSEIHFRIEDQFNTVLPRDVEVNVDYGADATDMVGAPDNWSVWNPGTTGEVGVTVAPADMNSVINVGTDVAGGAVPSPTPQNPQTPLSITKVDHRDGGFRCGSTNTVTGANNNPGIQVHSCVFQRYLDHGRYE